MPVARDRSRMDAPSYPLTQKTSVAWSRMCPRRRSKRGTGPRLGALREAREERVAGSVTIRSNVRSVIYTNHRTIEFESQEHFDYLLGPGCRGGGSLITWRSTRMIFL